MLLVRALCFFFLINCLFYYVCLGLQIEHEHFAAMLQRVGKILGKCSPLRMHSIGVVRHSRSDSNWPIEFVSNVPFVNLKDSETNEEFEALRSRNSSEKRRSLHIFLILTSSTDNFRRLIGKLRKTILWDPLAQYLILDDQTGTNGCQNALTFLNTSWVEDLLYSTYFCVHPEDGFTMYTYNPYSRRAPDSWKEVNPSQYTFKNHVWSLFRQTLTPGRTTCQDLYFDKTMTIDNYSINALMIQAGPDVQVNLSIPGLGKVYGSEGDVIISALEKLKPYLNLTVGWNITDRYKFLPNITNGEYDIFLNSQMIFNKPGMSLTYPHEGSGISVLTQFPGYEEQYMRVLTYMNPILIGLVVLVFTITSLVLFICTGKGLIRSSLEAYRLLLGTVILRSPRRNPLRIYLISIALLFLLTGSAFQSSLSSLLTVPIHKPYIDSGDDLRENSDLLIYVFHRYKDVVGDDWIQPQIKPINKATCTEYVKANPKAACAGEQSYMMMEAFKENLHVSKHKLTTLYLAFVVRPDWPLYERISSILAILFQTGIIRHLRERNIVNILQKWHQMEKEQLSKHVYNVMKLSDLIFAFYILLFGLGCASLVFFLECFMAKERYYCR